MSNILNPAFRYVPAHATDIRQTFARVRAQQQLRQQEQKDDVPYWFRAHAADEAADLERAATWRDIDTRR